MDYDQAHAGSSNATPIDDASMHTITASSLQQNPSYDPRPQTSYSDTGFSRTYSQSADNTPDRQFVEQQQNGNGLSRPGSGAQGSQYGENGQRQQAQKNASVVIKVGMVGDAQIGKTSLMVKYVEGSWDEDYIQTLGKLVKIRPIGCVLTVNRREFHGEDNQHSEHGDHLLDLGSWRTTRVRQYAPAGVQ